MDEKTSISFWSAVVSFLSLCATIYFARRAATAAGRSQAVALGSAELSLRSAITVTRQAVRQIGIEAANVRDGRRDDELNAAEKRKLGAYDSAFREALEDNLNAYEGACAKYLDEKIDRIRFRKMYLDEIGNLCRAKDSHPIHAFMHPADNSKFQAIWKVYREWHIHE
jgi:hypothetical protein